MRTGYDRFKEKHPELLKAAEHELEIEMASFNAGVEQCAASPWVDGEPPRDDGLYLCELNGHNAWFVLHFSTNGYWADMSACKFNVASEEFTRHARINTGAR